MTTKNRIAQLEKQKPQVKITWKDFIDWTNGKVFDADTEARLQKEWDEFMAKSVAEIAEARLRTRRARVR